MEHLRGLELLYLLKRDQLSCKEDCLLLVFHCLMINDGKKCVGVGDEWTESSPDRGSEALPTDWNSSHEIYTLRYTSESPPHQYLLKVVKAGSSLLVNLLDVNGEKAAAMVANTNSHVFEDFGEFSNIYINLEELSNKFHIEILSQFVAQRQIVHSCLQQCSSVRRDDSQQEAVPDPLTVTPVVNNPSQRQRHRHDDDQDDVFPFVGRGDLDPFAGGRGGGMLLDPRSIRFPGVTSPPDYGPHGIPRASIPPGARYDPVGPPGIGRGFTQPDPDHLPLPGNDDNPL